MSLPWLLSLAVGFLSLSQEILWVRLASFAYSGLPQVFSFVLANYLIGIAFGAMIGKWFCERSWNLYLIGAYILVAAGTVDILVIHFAGQFVGNAKYLPGLATAIILTAGLKSALFPIAHHLGSFQSGPRVGRSVSRVYFGNIIGSTLGPILTGFLMLEYFPVEACFLIIGISSIAVGVAVSVNKLELKQLPPIMGIASAIIIVALSVGKLRTIDELADRQADNKAIAHVIQNKHGILHTLHAHSGGRCCNRRERV